MRDHGNMPVLDWSDAKAPQKAKAQILHQEPIILQMPNDFDADIDGDEFGCALQEDSGTLLNCRGSGVLNSLATKNALPGLKIVADACAESNSQVDIDMAHKRIIVHD
jgi:hypothetical protein